MNLRKPESKILKKADLVRVLSKIRKTKSPSKVVFTNGCFDLLHKGHVTYLDRARRLGDFLIIGLNSDQSVQKLKGKDRPVQGFADRARVLAALECVDFVVGFSEDTPLNLITAAKPNILVKGGDYKIHQIVGADFVQALGGKVKVIPFIKGRSTSAILTKIRSLG